MYFFFFSSRRRHTRYWRDWSSDVCSSDLKDTVDLRSYKRKTNKLDAQKLARLARVDPELLYPIDHRGKDSQTHLALIHSRDALIRSRTQLINHIRGTVKSFGARLPKCSAESFHKKVAEVSCPMNSLKLSKTWWRPSARSPRG